MLYISRCVGLSDYGVVDTVDGCETIEDVKTILNAAVNLHIDILGVGSDDRNKEQIALLTTVQPYQLPEQVTALMAKYESMLGVRITVWNDTLTRVTVSPGIDSVRLRLSDFCKVCADRVFEESDRFREVTLVFDDAVTLSDFSFMPVMFSWASRYVTFDVRECTKRATVDYLYEVCGSSADTVIKDLPDRKNKMMSRYIR